MSPLALKFKNQIASSGAISFRDFMAGALYDPLYGYYGSGRARIGRTGDYFTNVSVGPLFGMLLARQFIEMWEVLGRPAPFDLIEQGAHDGTLANDITDAMRTLAPACPVRLSIIEPFENWKVLQSERHFSCETRWFTSLDALPPFIGVHFSNELPDAFPVHLLHRTFEGWRERFVTIDGDSFAFVDERLSSTALEEYVAVNVPDLPVGTVTEVNLEMRGWIGALSRKLMEGFALIIDYGWPRGEYYAPHRRAGTLEAVGGQRRESDPLARPGEVDLTAHVDFTALAEVAELAGLGVLGFTDQHHFLVGLSRLHFPDGTPPEPAQARAFETLAHPTMLGRAFKVLCLGKVDESPPLSGFTFAREPRCTLGLPP